MKPPKELNLAYPKALKSAEQAMRETEQDYADFLERIERYKARLDELRTEKTQLHQTGISKTAAGQLEDEADSRHHYDQVAFVEHEIIRYEQALKQLDTGHAKGEVHERFQVAKQDARQEWEQYWRSVQEAAADHIMGTVGVYLAEATHAYWSSATGQIDDWLLQVLSPRIKALAEGKRAQYAVQSTPPQTPKEAAAQADSIARAEASEAEIKASNQRKAKRSAAEIARRKWLNLPSLKRGRAPWLAG